MIDKTLMVYVILVSVCALGYIIYWLYNSNAEKKKELLKIFSITIIMLLMGYGCMLISKHYSVDSFNVKIDMSPFWHLQLGRYWNCGVILLAIRCGINMVESQQLWFAIWIVCTAVMVVMIYDSINNCAILVTEKKKWLLLFVIGIAVLNIYTMELMLFSEMAMVLAGANLFLGISIHSSLNEQKMHWVVAIFFLTAAIGSYQSYIGVYEAYVLIGLYLKNRESIKKRYVQTLYALSIGGAISIFNVFLTKALIELGIIVDSGRGAGLSAEILKRNIVELLKYQKKFWLNGDGIFPFNLMVLMGVGALGIFIFTMVLQKGIEKKAFLACIILGVYVLAFATHLIEQNITLTPRSNLAIWSFISILFILGIFLTENKYVINLMGLILCVIMICNVLTMQDMASNEQAMNAIDYKEAELICKKIISYEQNTGNIISKIATCEDTDCSHYQKLSRYRNYELGARIMTTSYSNYRLIGTILGQSIEKVDMPDHIYADNFAEKNWENLELDEQLVFDDDTLYLCIY